MRLSAQLTPETVQEAINFYKQHYAQCWAVHCNRCKNTIAILVPAEVAGQTPDHLGWTTIPIDEKLHSSRVRYDDNGHGEPMRGFHCKASIDNPSFNPKKKADPLTNPRKVHCNNNTIVGKIEGECAPQRVKETRVFEILPHEMPGFMARLKDAASQRPPIKKEGSQEFPETFTLERIA